MVSGSSKLDCESIQVHVQKFHCYLCQKTFQDLHTFAIHHSSSSHAAPTKSIANTRAGIGKIMTKFIEEKSPSKPNPRQNAPQPLQVQLQVQLQLHQQQQQELQQQLQQQLQLHLDQQIQKQNQSNQLEHCLEHPDKINVTCHVCNSQFASLNQFLAHLYANKNKNNKNVDNQNNCDNSQQQPLQLLLPPPPPQKVVVEAKRNLIQLQLVAHQDHHNVCNDLVLAPSSPSSENTNNNYVDDDDDDNNYGNDNSDSEEDDESYNEKENQGEDEDESENENEPENSGDDYCPSPSPNPSSSFLNKKRKSPENTEKIRGIVWKPKFKNVRCNFAGCPESFNTRADMRSHFKCHYFLVPIESEQDQSYIQGQNEQAESDNENENGSGQKLRYQCTVPGCGKTCSTTSILNYHHLNIHLDGARVHLCATCGKGFAQRNAYNRHLLIHIPPEDRPYKCTAEGCQESFNLPCYLRRHLAAYHPTESRPAPFACREEPCRSHPNSKFSFKTAAGLQHHHEKVHLGMSRSYPCRWSHCSRVFNKISELHVHAKVDHKKDLEQQKRESSLICEEPNCGKRFLRKGDLKAHLLTHTNRPNPKQSTHKGARLSQSQIKLKAIKSRENVGPRKNSRTFNNRHEEKNSPKIMRELKDQDEDEDDNEEEEDDEQIKEEVEEPQQEEVVEEMIVSDFEVV